MRIGRGLDRAFKNMTMKLKYLPFSKDQLSNFMNQVRQIMKNASDTAIASSSDKSFYSNVASALKSLSEDDQVMEQITNITKRLQGKHKR